MPWFIVDDGFHSHKKAVRAGASALGLWVLAGSWSADQLTDGFVPDYIAARLDREYEEHAADLVRAGLWVSAEVDGDAGWQFHEWSERQQSRDDVLAKRDAARDRMRRLRAAKRERSEGVRANKPRTSREVREPDTDTDTDTDTELKDIRASASPPRTSSEPSPGSSLKKKPQPGSDDDPDWLKFWDIYPLKKSKDGARAKWRAALKKAPAADIIAGAERYRDDPGRKPEFTKHPTSWLNQGCWADEPSLLPVFGHRPYQDPDHSVYDEEL